MKARRYFGLLVVTVVGAVIAVFIYARLIQHEPEVVEVPVENKAQKAMSISCHLKITVLIWLSDMLFYIIYQK